MVVTTPPAFEVILQPGEEYCEGDVGHMAGDEAVPMTGFDGDRFATLGLLMAVLGLLLLAAARWMDRRHRLRWSRLRLPV